MDILKKTTEMADGILDMAGWMFKRLESPGKLYSIEESRGLTALVSVGIKPGMAGEVILEMNGTRQHYCARSKNEAGELKRGSKVRIIDIAASTLFVVPEEYDQQDDREDGNKHGQIIA